MFVIKSLCLYFLQIKKCLITYLHLKVKLYTSNNLTIYTKNKIPGDYDKHLHFVASSENVRGMSLPSKSSG